ncbi:hypothetical protein ACODM8_14450 [Vibrio ostreicida]|uniref:hypothetical protein n=1 Tax=Vibrio ostreicida TaxID=526588 RepID=UPI003B5CD342
MKTQFNDYSSLLTHEKRVELGKKGAIASGSIPYSDYEIQYLIGNYGVISLKQIAKHLGRTYYSVVDKRKKLALQYDINFFTEKEDHYIRANALKLTQLQVANNLGRTRSSIARRAILLGVRFIKASDDSPKTKYPQEDIELIRDLRDEGLTYTEIGWKFDIHKAYIRQLCIFEARLYDSTECYHQMLDIQKNAIHGQT